MVSRSWCDNNIFTLVASSISTQTYVVDDISLGINIPNFTLFGTCSDAFYTYTVFEMINAVENA
jgi:hypothetical protein